MSYGFLLTGMGIGVLSWISAEKKWKWAVYLTKPAVILLFLAWLWQNDLLGGSMLWFCLGLVFSLAGDILLMLPVNLFIPGLVAFFVAQVLYLIGFNLSVTSISVPVLIVALIFLGGAQIIYRRLVQSLREHKQEKLKLPIAFYTTAISLMAVSAMFTLANPAWNTLHAVIATCGAVLFVISDSLLAWNKFVNAIPHAPALIKATYHLGQMGIILGVALHFY